MLTEVGPNKRFNLKLVGIPVFIILWLVSIGMIMYPGANSKSYSIIFACIFSVTIATITLMFIFQVLFIPNRVIIDSGLNQLTLRYLIGKQKIINPTEIDSYKNIFIPTKAGPCYGVVIYLQNKKEILLSDLNLNGYIPVKTYLEDLNITSTAEKVFYFLPYFMHQ